MLLLFAALHVGCGGGAGTPEQGAAQDTLIQNEKGLHEIKIEMQAARAHEMTCVRADFPKYVQQTTSGSKKPFEPRNPALQVTVNALQNAVAAAEQACAGAPGVKGEHAVIVHHGLLTNGEYDAFIQVVCLSYDENDGKYTYAATDDGYTVDGQGGMVYDATGHTKWYASGGPGDRYASKTFIMHEPGGSWTAYDAASDRRAMVFPYEQELALLIAHNDLSGTSMLLIEPYAEATLREDLGGGQYNEKGYFHGVAWVPVDIVLDDTIDIQHPFKAKAADLGAPCPVNCAGEKFKFPTSGAKPRTTC